ncbi:MAG TPA: hypothetical protein VIK89_00430 [Cytophagaceae bacterium]
MKKYKINRNKKVLSDERINSHKDFNKLLDNYQHIYHQKQANRPLYKKPGFMGFIMLVLLITFVIVTVTDKEEQWINAKEKAKKGIIDSSKTTINQPSEQINEPQQTNDTISSERRIHP